MDENQRVEISLSSGDLLGARSEVFFINFEKKRSMPRCHNGFKDRCTTVDGNPDDGARPQSQRLQDKQQGLPTTPGRVPEFARKTIWDGVFRPRCAGSDGLQESRE